VAFVTKMSEKHCITWCNSSEKSAKDSQYWREIRHNTVCQVEKGEQIVDTCQNVRLACSRVRTIHNDADRIPESAKRGSKVFV
jgi:hypothetical protein